MYHCHIHFYCIGRHRELYEKLEQQPARESFTHSFTIADEPDQAAAAEADVIFADLREQDAEKLLQCILPSRKADAELILLSSAGQTDGLDLSQVSDLWPVPMNERELCFRFGRWQDRRKKCMDSWQDSHYLDATINSSPNLIWYKSKSGIHEKVNDSFCRTVGKTKAEVEGQSHAYIWNVESDDPACIESENAVMEARATCVSEERIQTGEGERILSTYKSPLYDCDGSVMGTVGVALDVTQVRAYEQALLEKNRTLEQLFTTMECGVLCHTVDGSRILSINHAALRILGYRSQQEMEEDGFDVIASSVVKEDQPILRQCIQMLHRVNESTNIEYRVRHKDGTLLHVIGNIKLMREGGTWYYQRFLLDCTAQKLREQDAQNRMDQRIKYQEQLFNIFSTYLANNTDDVYCMLSSDGSQLEYISPNVERVLGLSLTALERNVNILNDVQFLEGMPVSAEDLRRMEPGDALDTRESRRYNPATGEEKWFRESVYCVSLQGEKKIIAYLSDRTKERKTHKNLVEALDMAQVANKAKSAFLSNVSHDIRTPMNAIMGFIPLLKEEADNPDRVREYIQRIDAASQHLLGLINDVLDMNKIESGIATLNLAEMNLAELIDEINTIIRPQARAKEQRFDIHTSALTYEHLIGDRLRINQILINILSNAVKYTQKGGTISMTVTELPQVMQNYSRIQFSISDNGQGMSEAYQKVIFTPFTREQESTTNQIQGTGLGMSITKSLVDLMNGTIRLDSKIGKGSTFTVELELRIQEQALDPGFWTDHRIRRMLVVDDDEDTCSSIAHSMSKTGVSVDIVLDGQSAANMISQAYNSKQPYDLVLLDWKMPGLNGLDTARLIRNMQMDKLPIVVFTAYDWEDIKIDASAVGIEHFLSKPFFMSNFKETVRRVNGTRPHAAAAMDNAVEGKRILVVDDIEVNRMILAKILGTRGAVCEMAENGQEALEKFEASAPGEYDIIMMDIQMPIMDGYTAAKAIRASSHPSAKKVAIIAMTANAFVDDVREALSSGMDAHIAKPIVMDKMMASIREVLLSKQS